MIGKWNSDFVKFSPSPLFFSEFHQNAGPISSSPPPPPPDFPSVFKSVIILLHTACVSKRTSGFKNYKRQYCCRQLNSNIPGRLMHGKPEATLNSISYRKCETAPSRSCTWHVVKGNNWRRHREIKPLILFWGLGFVFFFLMLYLKQQRRFYILRCTRTWCPSILFHRVCFFLFLSSKNPVLHLGSQVDFCGSGNFIVHLSKKCRHRKQTLKLHFSIAMDFIWGHSSEDASDTFSGSTEFQHFWNV